MNNQLKHYLLKGDEGNTVAVITSGDDFEDRLKQAISDEYCGDKVVNIRFIKFSLEDLHSRVGFTVPIEVDMIEETEYDEGVFHYDCVRDFTLEQVILY